MRSAAAQESTSAHNPISVSSLTADALAAVLDQSGDCIKIIDADGIVQYMNPNGQCAMEIDNFAAIAGTRWVDLWLFEMEEQILSSYEMAASGKAARFSAFCSTAKGTPRWWDVSVSAVRDTAGTLSYLSISRDVTRAELALRRLRFATVEMRHRLKNSYAIVAGLLAGFVRGIPERETFAQDMIGRLAAMAVAQTLFVSREHAPCTVSDLILALVTPFDRPDCPVVVDALTQDRLDQGQADAIALVIGELTVNSNKHGALGSVGTVHVHAENLDGRLAITWSERSDRKVEAHSRDGGQGLKLMKRIIGARHGDISLNWHMYGLDAVLTFEIEKPPILQSVI